MLLTITVLRVDFGPMKHHEMNAIAGDLFTTPGRPYEDHCSPISDTTIMASAGGHCEHVNHVATQLPYVGLVAAVCMIGYFIIGVLQAVGLTQFSLLALPVCIVLLVAILFVIREKTGGKEEI